MKTISLSLLGLALMYSTAGAQNKRFTLNGSIEYEKTINVFAIIKKSIIGNSQKQQLFDKFQASQNQFVVLKSKLLFTQKESLFVPIDKKNDVADYFGVSPIISQPNTVYTNLQAGRVTAQKNVLDKVFLVDDSLKKIKWKYTDEIRNIAGYDCKRANGIFLDSIYIVAFYTEEIPISGGPESFSGLPGMILGVALPRENITWFATKVTDTDVATFKKPDTGEKTDSKALTSKLDAMFEGKNLVTVRKSYLF
jgi:GLPGLI family protein